MRSFIEILREKYKHPNLDKIDRFINGIVNLAKGWDYMYLGECQPSKEDENLVKEAKEALWRHGRNFNCNLTIKSEDSYEDFQNFQDLKYYSPSVFLGIVSADYDDKYNIVLDTSVFGVIELHEKLFRNNMRDILTHEHTHSGQDAAPPEVTNKLYKRAPDADLEWENPEEYNKQMYDYATQYWESDAYIRGITQHLLDLGYSKEDILAKLQNKEDTRKLAKELSQEFENITDKNMLELYLDYSIENRFDWRKVLKQVYKYLNEE
jgi:hypothetical protein